MSLASNLKTKIKSVRLPRNRWLRMAVFVVPFAIIGAVLLGINYAGTNTILVKQGETFSGGGSGIINYSKYSGQKAIKISTSYSATSTITLKERGYKILVRGVGDSCEGAPELEVLIGGQVVMTEPYPNRTFKLGIRNIDIPAGTHNISLRLKNPLSTANCRRAAYVDVIYIEKKPASLPADTTQPVVRLTSPSAGTVLKDTIELSATATDDRGVAKVEFFVAGVNNGSPIGTDITAPYTTAWDTTKLGDSAYSISVRATDTSGNISTSLPVSFNVKNTVSPSGEPMPLGDLPGWRQIFTDDFTANVPLGSFPAAVKDKWGAYPYPWRDTTGKHQGATDGTIGGWYHPGKTISIANGMMDLWLHTELIDGVKKRLAAAPVPLINGANATGPLGTNGQLYGRYAARFRVDPTRIVNNFEGYKVAWLTWPKGGEWPRDGEIDFPEGNLSGNIEGFLHKQGATSGSDQYWANSGKKFTEWHTAVIEWGPGRGAFYLDGALITNASGGKSEWFDRIPNTPMFYVMQSETALGGGFLRAPETSEGHIQIDWVAIWAKQ